MGCLLNKKNDFSVDHRNDSTIKMVSGGNIKFVSQTERSIPPITSSAYLDVKSKPTKDSNVAYAKTDIFQSGATVYYVRKYADGPHTGLLVDPINNGIILNMDAPTNSNNGPAYPFVSVSQECFNNYIVYLVKKNPNYYLQANRLIQKGV
jgi:hypothetical protein